MSRSIDPTITPRSLRSCRIPADLLCLFPVLFIFENDVVLLTGLGVADGLPGGLRVDLCLRGDLRNLFLGGGEGEPSFAAADFFFAAANFFFAAHAPNTSLHESLLNAAFLLDKLPAATSCAIACLCRGRA